MHSITLPTIFAGPDTVKDALETPMDVCDENMVTSGCSTSDHTNVQIVGNNEATGSSSTLSSSHVPHLLMHGCDNSNSSTLGTSSMSPQASLAVNDSDVSLGQLPFPRHISEQELHVLQVKPREQICSETVILHILIHTFKSHITITLFCSVWHRIVLAVGRKRLQRIYPAYKPL